MATLIRHSNRSFSGRSALNKRQRCVLATASWLGSMLPETAERAEHAARRRDRDDREREQHEAAEREALKNMTEAERRAWEAAHPKARSLQTAALP